MGGSRDPVQSTPSDLIVQRTAAFVQNEIENTSNKILGTELYLHILILASNTPEHRKMPVPQALFNERHGFMGLRIKINYPVFLEICVSKKIQTQTNIAAVNTSMRQFIRGRISERTMIERVRT